MTDEKIKEELKPCPFCGCKPNIMSGKKCDDDWGRFWRKSHEVVCLKCSISIGESESRKESIKIWNTRAAERLAKIEVLEHLLKKYGFVEDMSRDALNEISDMLSDLKGEQ